ncbi:replicative DNA helicase [Streptomyces sp. Ac-502]|uniref:replicative DNA helicase n=1 Tax=Streptomyces sp. Ac-502 TaxID=3342801 RepID=UPI00386230BC
MTDEIQTEDSTEPVGADDEHPDLFGVVVEGALDDIESAGQAQGAEEALWPPMDDAQLPGLPTGFTDLDSLTGGLCRGSLTVIASRPSMGRTTLLTDVCRHVSVKLNVPVGVFTLEETRHQFVHRVLTAESRVVGYHMRTGKMIQEDWTRLARRMPELAATPMYLKAPGRITMAELAEQAEELVREQGVRLIAVDGIQDIRPEKRSDLREREVGDVVRDLKTMARELDVAVLATSHLNRGPENRIDKKPRLDDLRESGAITFAADTVILLHREDYYLKESPRAGEADLIVAKHRHGPTAYITVAFQAHYGRFVDLPRT